MTAKRVITRFFGTQTRLDRASSSNLLSPRVFPTSGFETLDSSEKCEEESIPDYNPKLFYPVRIGEVFRNRFQVVGKLGYGSRSTVWLGHDLRDRRYIALKVQINVLKENRELDVYRHLNKIINDRSILKRAHIRELYNSFDVQGPHGTHKVLVQSPLGVSLRELQHNVRNKVFPPTFVKGAFAQVLPALELLHTEEVNVTYTDFHSGNLLISVGDDGHQAAAFSQFEETEFQNPTPRKEGQGGGRTIYESRVVLRCKGPLYLCDFGEARIGSVHRGPAMPMPYRAPEVILGMPWDNAIDMWSVGLTACNLLLGNCPFRIYNQDSEEMNDAHHLADMIGLMGPPPLDFLQRNKAYLHFWDENGNWRELVPIPEGRSFDVLEKSLQKKDAEMAGFVDFLRALLRWQPEERLKIDQALDHPWLIN